MALGLGLALTAATAQQPPAPREPVPVPASGAPRTARTGEPVSMEFLEFLGAWETEDGVWLDPTQLDPTAPVSLVKQKKGEAQD